MRSSRRIVDGRRQGRGGGLADLVEGHAPRGDPVRREPLGLGEQAECHVTGGDLVVPGALRLVLGGDDRVPRPGGEAAEPRVRVHLLRVRVLGDEALLGRLAGDAHAAADVGPGGAGAPGLVHEVADEVIGDLAEVVRRDDRVGELVQRVGVDLLDRVDEFVEADRDIHADWIRHEATLG